MTHQSQSSLDKEAITEMVNAAYAGDSQMMNRLIPLVYQELRLIAARQRRRQGNLGNTLNTTAVVNEAWIRLYNHDQHYQNRHHFLAVAATAMRQLITDEARRQLRAKRGGGKAIQVTLGEHARIEDQSQWLLALDQALNRLDRYNSRLRQVFELRFFAGLGENDISRVLYISERTVQRDWAKAKAMLARAL